MNAGPSKGKKTMTKEITKKQKELKAGPSKRKKTVIEEFNPLAELQALPVEILVKIFNFLPRSGHFCGPSSAHQVFSGLSLVCKKFEKICQDESLFPVRDLCIRGQPVDWESEKESESERKGQEGKKRYMTEYFDVEQLIKKSKNLTFLKINSLNSECTNDLVSCAFKTCPNLIQLEIIENSNQIGEYFICKSKVDMI